MCVCVRRAHVRMHIYIVKQQLHILWMMNVLWQNKNKLQIQVSKNNKHKITNNTPKFLYTIFLFLLLLWCNSPMQARATSLMRFLNYTNDTPTVSRTPVDGWFAQNRHLYLTAGTPMSVHAHSHTHTCKRQTSMPPARFKPIIQAGDWL